MFKSFTDYEDAHSLFRGIVLLYYKDQTPYSFKYQLAVLQGQSGKIIQMSKVLTISTHTFNLTLSKQDISESGGVVSLNNYTCMIDITWGLLKSEHMSSLLLFICLFIFGNED